MKSTARLINEEKKKIGVSLTQDDLACFVSAYHKLLIRIRAAFGPVTNAFIKKYDTKHPTNNKKKIKELMESLI